MHATRYQGSRAWTRRLAAGLATSGLILAGLLVAAPLSGDEKQASEAPQGGTPPHPVVSTHELMELYNRPLYMYLKEEMQKGVPESDKRWSTLRDRGLQAAELANLVAIRERREGQREKWIEHAAQLQKAGLQLAEVAKAQNTEKLQEAYVGVIHACNDCHNTFAPDQAPQLKP